jgi:hypothetical protein
MVECKKEHIRRDSREIDGTTEGGKVTKDEIGPNGKKAANKLFKLLAQEAKHRKVRGKWR